MQYLFHMLHMPVLNYHTDMMDTSMSDSVDITILQIPLKSRVSNIFLQDICAYIIIYTCDLGCYFITNSVTILHISYKPGAIKLSTFTYCLLDDPESKSRNVAMC